MQSLQVLKKGAVTLDKNRKMTDCIFCKIAKGEIPSQKIYEDENIFAFLDIKPFTEGHTLVIPKIHYENIFDIPKEVLEKIILASKEISLLLKEKLNAEGVNLSNSNGKIAQQDVFHFHMHLIPRYPKDKFKFTHINN